VVLISTQSSEDFIQTTRGTLHMTGKMFYAMENSANR
jgi:hypothetical protein